MNIFTIFRYLVGSRSAILALANSKWTILLGVIFVISAGLAREYDGEDLVREPWHALRPLAASLVTGTTLFLIIHAVYMIRRRDPAQPAVPFFFAYRTFLGLFWMTAPMAWLYAIPYERLMQPIDAIILNLWTLALVAGWRVVLMIRVVHVLYGIKPLAAFFFVMMFADAVLLAVMHFASLPVIDVMGGIRHNDRDAFIANTAFSLILLGILTAPVWVISSLISIAYVKPRWHAHNSSTTATPNTDNNDSTADQPTDTNNTSNIANTEPPSTKSADPFPRNVFIFAAAAVLAFIPPMLITQPEQMNRRHAELLLTTDRVSEAFEFMSSKQPRNFPPAWDPPPRTAYRELKPTMLEIRIGLRDVQPAEWVEKLFTEKLNEIRNHHTR